MALLQLGLGVLSVGVGGGFLVFGVFLLWEVFGAFAG